MGAVLSLAAVYGRKFCNQTGSLYPGALINTMIFTRAVAGNISFRKYGLVFQKRCR